MKPFELKIDLNTPYIRVIHFLGAAGIGFFIAAVLFTYKFDGQIEWMNTVTGIICCALFAFFPGAAKKQSLTVDEDGIRLQNYTFHWGQKKEISWEQVRKVEVKNSSIHIINGVGSAEKIKLPLYTKKQKEALISYLKEVTLVKGMKYGV